MLVNGSYIGFWQNNVRHGQGKLTKIDKESELIIVYNGVWDSD